MADLITTQDLSDKLGRDVTADAGADLAVAAACQIVKTVAEQDFTSATNDVQVFDGTGTDALLLPERPVTRIREVLVDGGTVTDWALKSNGVLVRSNGGTAGSCSTWPSGRQNVSVKYDHGYSSADVPADVKAVALAVASRQYIQGPKGAIAETIGDVSIRYAVSETDLTNGEKLILRKYRQAS